MDPKRRRTVARPGAEALEGRSLLTGGAGNTFALTSADIVKTGGATSITFKLDSAHFTTPTHGKLKIGIDIVPDTGSTVVARVTDVKGPGKTPVHLSHVPHSTAVFATIDAVPVPGKIDTYTVDLAASRTTSGKLLVGFYLPGDANGDGAVTSADVTAVKAALGSKSTDTTKYSFDADADRNGRINKADLAITKHELGATADIMPVITANLAPGNGGLANRVSTLPNASFAGVASPGATITYAEITSKSSPVTTTADSKGNYSLVVPLGVGSNTFQVTSVDTFNQVISGQVAPVTYTPAP